jgi:glycosyltransferase involved in cell wall biosynthesis
MSRILIINWRDIKNPEAGGAEIYYHEIFRRLAAKGWGITLLCHAFPGGADREMQDGIEVIRYGGKFTFNFQVPFYLLSRKNEFDLVIEDLNKVPFYTPLYYRRPKMTLVMHLFQKAIFRETVWPLALYIYLAERLIGRVYRKVRHVAISPSTRDDLAGLGIPAAQIDIIPCGIDTTQFYPDPLVPRRKMFFYVGRIKKYKNVQFCLHFLKHLGPEYGEYVLEIAGAGDYAPELKKLAEELGLGERVRFLGFIDEETKCRKLREAKVFLNPSAKEGWGITNIEANACATPVLASRVPGIKDSVKDGYSGCLFAYDDFTEAKTKLELILRDENTYQTFCRNSVEWALRLTWDQAATDMERIMQNEIQQTTEDRRRRTENGMHF